MVENKRFCLRCGKELDASDLEEGFCLICGESIPAIGASGEDEAPEESEGLQAAPEASAPAEVEWIEDGGYAICPLCQAAYNREDAPAQCERCAQDPEYARAAWVFRENDPRMYLLYADGMLEIPLTDGLVLGREHTECLARDLYVSRRHASVMIRNGHVLVADQNSENGTWINDRRLIPGSFYLLHEGDTLRLDNQSFRVGRERP